MNFDSAWETQVAIAGAGISGFGASDITTIEAKILSEMQRIYSDYQMTFSVAASDPGGTRDRIDFGDTAAPGALGVAPTYLLTNRSHDETSAATAANVFSGNFAFTATGGTTAEQINNLGTALAGTAAHELGHSLGLLHSHSYGNEGISPANYNATADIQNSSVIATGSTGLDTAGRQSQRSLGKWEQALLDVGGGGVFAGPTLVNAPVFEELEGADAGSTAGTAKALTTSTGETSGLILAHLRGELDGSAADIDFYSFSVSSAGTLTAEVISENIYGASFDSIISIFDTDGTTLLGSNQDASYNGNDYDVGEATGSSPTFGEDDPFLPNVSLSSAGTYYIRITVEGGGAIGDDYTLLAGFDAISSGAAAPEPSSLFLALMGAGLLRHTRKKKLRA